jgi:polysaccharide chain length determinant protein (PEP-CTERM system associated)
MVRSGDISLSDVKRTLRRYWWVLAITTVVCGAVGVAAAVLLPKRYRSETMILVKQPTVPVDIVKPIITGDLSHRLASMQEQILSRSRLQPIIDKFHLYENDRAKLSDDDLVGRLRNSVKITPLEPMQGTDNRQLPGFYVDVEFDNPRLAQQICSEITSMFLEQNAKEREQQASRTTTFLTEQLEEAKTKLDDQDARLAQFKRQYLGSLPEEEQTNLGLLTGLNSQLEANTQALSRAEQDRAFNDSLLSAQEAGAKASPSGQIPDATQVELDTLKKQLAVLLANYTPKHPDVAKLQGQIEELKKRQSESPKPDSSTSDVRASASASPQAQQLRAKIRQDEINIGDLTKRQGQIQEQIRQLQARVQASPVVEQQLKEQTRNYQTALDFYNDLLKKRATSAMATDLEHQQDSEQFSVFDPPSVPDKPSSPNQTTLAGGGFSAGLAMGLGLLYLIAYTDKSLHTERDVEKCLKLPVLTLIPKLDWTEDPGAVGAGPGLAKMNMKKSA